MSSFFEQTMGEIETLVRSIEGLENCVYRDLLVCLTREDELAVILEWGKSTWDPLAERGKMRVRANFQITVVARSDDWGPIVDDVLVKVSSKVLTSFLTTNKQFNPVETQHASKSADIPVGSVTQIYEIDFLVSKWDIENLL